MGKGVSLPFLRVPLSQAPPYIHQPGSLLNPILLDFFMEASLHGHDLLNHWPVSGDWSAIYSPSPFPRGLAGGTESSSPLIT